MKIMKDLKDVWQWINKKPCIREKILNLGVQGIWPQGKNLGLGSRDRMA